MQKYILRYHVMFKGQSANQLKGHFGRKDEVKFTDAVCKFSCLNQWGAI